MSSYNHVIMRTHRWPYGPCFTIFLHLHTLNHYDQNWKRRFCIHFFRKASNWYPFISKPFRNGNSYHRFLSPFGPRNAHLKFSVSYVQVLICTSIGWSVMLSLFSLLGATYDRASSFVKWFAWLTQPQSTKVTLLAGEFMLILLLKNWFSLAAA